MCKKLIVLTCLISVLSVAGSASGKLVAYWPFDEGSAIVAADLSGFGNNGALEDGPTVVEGTSGLALAFANSRVTIPASDSLGANLFQGSFTLTAWINPTRTGNTWQQVFRATKAAGTSNDTLFLNNDGRLSWRGRVAGTWAGGMCETAANVVPANQWTHVAVTGDGTNFRIYVNAALSQEAAFQKTDGANENYYIGGTSGGESYSGMIDEVRLYDQVLSVADTKKLAARPKAQNPSPADGAILTETWVSLGWTPGDFAASHDVYIAESFQDVNAGTPGAFRGNQTGASFFLGLGLPGDPYPAGLVPGTTYYWRIDEVNTADPNSPWRGKVWSFSIPPRKAYNPGPPNAAKYVQTDVALSWTAGLNAKLHYVYFGDNLDTVTNATTGGMPRAALSYTPAGPLAKGKAYYWRVDEFDGAATHKGDVWSFTTLSDIAISNPDLIGWWKFDEGYGKKAIDFSGHGNDGTLGGDPLWIEGVIGGGLDLSGNDYVVIDGIVNDMTGTNVTLSAWIRTTQSSEGEVFAANDSASAHPVMFGIDGGSPYVNDGADVQFSSAVNDNQWHMITYVRSGSSGIIYVDGVQVGTYAAAWSKDTITRWSIGQEWDTATPSDFYRGAVDDVRIYNKALNADEVKQLTRGDLLAAWSPSPSSRAVVDVERARQPLTWTRGDKASQHDVYFGLDKVAVTNATASDTTGLYRGRQSTVSYSPTEALGWGTGPYYWRVDEVNTDGTITQGGIWSFSVAGYLIVDDIESYNDIDPPNAGSNRVFDKWIDGFGTTTNAGLVGNTLPPYTQRTNPHSGGQAMPFSYDNNRKFSEATLTLTAGKDWTREGVANLSLWYRGAAANAAEKMYVVLNGTAVVYNNDTTLTQKTGWTEWVIQLQQFTGVSLTNVTSITIGFGTRGNTTVVGGTGQMYIDDIRLYRP